MKRLHQEFVREKNVNRCLHLFCQIIVFFWIQNLYGQNSFEVKIDAIIEYPKDFELVYLRTDGSLGSYWRLAENDQLFYGLFGHSHPSRNRDGELVGTWQLKKDSIYFFIKNPKFKDLPKIIKQKVMKLSFVTERNYKDKDHNKSMLTSEVLTLLTDNKWDEQLVINELTRHIEKEQIFEKYKDDSLNLHFNLLEEIEVFFFEKNIFCATRSKENGRLIDMRR